MEQSSSIFEAKSRRYIRKKRSHVAAVDTLSARALPILANPTSQRPSSRSQASRAPAASTSAPPPRSAGRGTPSGDRPSHSSASGGSGTIGRRKGTAASAHVKASSAASASAPTAASKEASAAGSATAAGPGAGAGAGTGGIGAQYDATSHPSLAAWQRFFARHQGSNLLPSSTSAKGTGSSRKGDANADSKSAATGSKSGHVTHVANEAAHEEAMRRLRKLILTHGIPADEFQSPAGSTYRSVTWKLLLEVRSVSAESYLTLVRHGRSAAYDKIRNDTFRTLATDQGFKRRVQEDKLIRLLNAFVWKHANDHMQAEPPAHGYDFSYVQGMNVLAAPFLYVMPSELEAFHCFSRFIEVCCPLYVQPTLAGVHRGLRLLDICLELADPHLFNYLRSKNLSAEIYAFPSVLTLCACTPPLDQVLQLWDFLLSFGVHLNILCVVSQLLLMRDDLMHNPSPMRLLRNFPPLEAQPIIGITVTLVRDLPDALYEELVNHTFDPRAVA
ncbi:CDC16 protein [Tilletia horrida]|nr:CDC16 protein [Tilletia horrida]